MSVFISAHGCKLEKKINLVNSELFFEANDGDICMNYFEHPLNMNTKKYPYKVKQAGPRNPVDDYAIVFYWDYMENMNNYEFSKNNIGIFYPNEQNEYVNLLALGQIIGSKGEVFLLSDIINYFKGYDVLTRFYLSICRADCDDVFNKPNFEFRDFEDYLKSPYVKTAFEKSEEEDLSDIVIDDEMNNEMNNEMNDGNTDFANIFNNFDDTSNSMEFDHGGKYSKKKKKRKRTKKRITKRRNKKRRTVKKKKNYKKKKN